MRPSLRLLVRQGTSEVFNSASKHLQRVITPLVADALRTDGFVVVEGAFGSSCADRLVEEMQDIRNTPHMIKNATHLVKDGQTRLLEKDSIWELDTLSSHWPEVQKSAHMFGRLHTDFTLGTTLNAHLPELCLDSQALKVQWNNGGGGCFPLHFDSDRDLDRRQVTAIVYLNKDWTPEDGGQLRVYPFPCAPVEIEPVFDRMVLFSSPNMLHRVMPSHRPRMCFTVWYSSSFPPAPSVSTGALPPSAVAKASASRLLLDHKYRKMLAKAIYADEWAESIRQSHEDSEARTHALETHWKDVGIITRVFRGVLPEVDSLVASSIHSLARQSTPHSALPPSRTTAPPLQVKWLE